MKYTEFVKSLPCCITGTIDTTDCHHIIGYNWLTGKGLGIKGSDLATIPLSRELHAELHSIGWKSFELKYNMSQLEGVVKTILQAEKSGLLVIK